MTEERAKIAMPRRVVRKGLVIVNTGDGKGKTTAALGLLLRAWGRGMGVCMFQFLKHTGANFGEHRAARKLGIPVIAIGDGFTWRSKDMDKTRDLAVRQWEDCKAAILAGEDDVIVLDEFTYLLHRQWVAMSEVLDVLGRRRPTLHVVITGRDAPQELIDFADMVTEMREIKHPLRDQGIRAQPGIEF